MRVVIAHEWLTNIAGSEAVMRAFADLYEDATVVCGVADPDLVASYLPGRCVKSLLSPRLPGVLTNWARYAPLLLAQWSRLRLECDLLLVSSHFGAHRAAIRTDAPSLVYYHSPMRLAWRPDIELPRVPSALRPLAAVALPVIRCLDARAARHGGVLVANSSATARRVQTAYGREAAVVHPPVPSAPTDAWTPGRPAPVEPYYLYLGRLVAYKRPDLAVAACAKLGRRLIVAGYGPMLDDLRRAAPPSISFVEHPDDAEKWRLLKGARALVFPGEEDFGIVPVEALAVGTPVVGLRRGGILDSVDSPLLGELFDAPDQSSLTAAILRFEERVFDPDVLRTAAMRFSERIFKSQILSLIESHGLPAPEQ